jgi:hypothetical protein
MEAMAFAQSLAGLAVPVGCPTTAVAGFHYLQSNRTSTLPVVLLSEVAASTHLLAGLHPTSHSRPCGTVTQRPKAMHRHQQKVMRPSRYRGEAEGAGQKDGGRHVPRSRAPPTAAGSGRHYKSMRGYDYRPAPPMTGGSLCATARPQASMCTQLAIRWTILTEAIGRAMGE